MTNTSEPHSFLSLCKEYEHCTKAIQGVEFNLIQGYLEQIMNILAIEKVTAPSTSSTGSAFTAPQTVEDLKAGAKATFDEITKSLNAKMSSGAKSNLDQSIEQEEAVLAQAITNNLVTMIYEQDKSLQETHVVLRAALAQALAKMLAADTPSKS